MITLMAATFLALPGCIMPDNFLVNIASSGSLTATNTFISAMINGFTGLLFGSTGASGGSGASGDTGDEAGDEHAEDGDEH
jgi:hypothetical protein